jgi:maltose O-acetyltransferase
MRTAGPLTLGRDCWLGARVTVLDAACIGDRCVIGAGAVVTRPVPDRTLAVGTPARAVKSI